MRHKT